MGPGDRADAVRANEPQLADAGFEPAATVRVGRDRAELVAACIDVDARVLDRGTLPPLWHWACFVPTTPTAGLGPDGHPIRRAAMVDFPQRMWVGGRIRTEAPLVMDEPATRTSRLSSSAAKTGSLGDFWLMTVEHQITQAGRSCVVEEQDIVLRQAVPAAPPGPPRPDAPEARWVEPRDPDAVLLFRFSAATNNAHRIHYDAPYATGVEGYPDLVVQGPLLAVLLADLATRRTGTAPRVVDFRARAPVFAHRRLWLTGDPVDGGADTAAVRDDGVVAMSLEARER